MRGPVSLLLSLLTALTFVGYTDILTAQGRGAGGGARAGAPPQAKTPPQAITPTQAGQGRGRPQAPSGRPADAAARGQGKRAGAARPPAAAGERAGAEAPREVPVWARERRPPTAGELVAHNPQLAARLQTLLPGADLQAASSRFSNLGQFVAAVHVSDNLGIPFDQVKAKMVGENLSLGAAIQALRPEADADAAAGRAEGQARANMQDVREN